MKPNMHTQISITERPKANSGIKAIILGKTSIRVYNSNTRENNNMSFFIPLFNV